MSIRSTAKAIIVNDGKILLNRCYDRYHGEYFSLPGGGQKDHETLYEAVIRECLEETGYTVIPVSFIALFEEICDNPNFKEKYPEYAHKMYHIFKCTVSGTAVKTPTETDTMQLSTEWVELSALKNINLYPQALGTNMDKIINSECPLFLGSEHILYNHG